MRLSKFIERTPQVKVKQRSSKSAVTSIISHASFVPMLTIWGAALFGLAVMVLSPAAITRISTLSGLGALGGFAQMIFAAVAAAVGGLSAYAISAALRNRMLRSDEGSSIVSAMASRRNRPINPSVELGSESLDAPIEELPFGVEEGNSGDQSAGLITDESEAEDVSDQPPLLATKKPTLGELSMRGYEEEKPVEPEAKDEAPDFTRRHFKDALIETCEAASVEQEAEVEGDIEADAEADRPQALDLGEFAEMPGRDAVWVQEATKPESEAEPAEPEPVANPAPIFATSVPPEGALEKLRQKLPEELSLVEMVERFAGALHEHQQTERTRLPQNPPMRDAALAEALKALTLFTERGFDTAGPDTVDAQTSELGQTERELRDALVKLQSLRGAA